MDLANILLSKVFFTIGALNCLDFPNSYDRLYVLFYYLTLKMTYHKICMDSVALLSVFVHVYMFTFFSAVHLNSLFFRMH